MHSVKYILTGILFVTLAGGCLGNRPKILWPKDAVLQKDRCEVRVQTEGLGVDALGEELKEGAEAALESAGPVRSGDRYTYVIQVNLQVDLDQTGRRVPVGYLDADARIIRKVDGYIVGRKHFWEVHSLKKSGNAILRKKSRSLGATITKWATSELP